MKIATKVFLIIGIVSGAIICGMSAIYIFTLSSFGLFAFALTEGLSVPITAVMFSILIIGVVIIVVGTISLRRLDSATSKKELVGTGVCCLIFCNIVAGILMLCIRDKDLRHNDNSGTATIANLSSFVEKLKQIKELKESGIISEDEFLKLKERYTKNL